jgi:hypothetical protein
MAPRERPLPEARPTVTKGGSVDTRDSSARDAHEPHGEEAHEASENLGRGCFYCLEGWVFLGSIAPDGEEVYEAVRCRRCGGTGKL